MAVTVLQLTALAQPNRLQMFRTLLVAGSDGLDRAQLVRETGATRSAVTFNIKALARCGLVKVDLSARRVGVGARKTDGDFRCVAMLAALETLLSYIEDADPPVGMRTGRRGPGDRAAGGLVSALGSRLRMSREQKDTSLAEREWTAEDETSLAVAVGLLEKETFIDTLLGMAGAAASAGMRGVSAIVPAKIGEGLGDMLAQILQFTFDKVLLTVDQDPSGLTSSSWFARVSVALSGGGGGLAGLPGTLVELPVTTALLMRSIAQIAASEGEDLSTPEAKLECLKVFAFGGPGSGDDEENEGYFATRVALASGLPRLVEKSIADIVPALAARVSGRFAPLVSAKLGSQGVAVVGAVAGMIVNSAFADHFERKARGHFVVRRLERAYGEAAVLERYDALKNSLLSIRRGSKAKPATEV
ncbi:EcsC family protein [Caulobacter sp. FWC2]|uniref:EcsC family protein n=1 Tax=Caulobacter sp. FWC2 TaxID=69664 RepID=UPI001177D51E|nr:EcsC family protein [Caulobacter sp. FWC2]